MKRSIVRLAKAAISPVKKLKLFVKQQLGWLQRPIIQPFRGFGDSNYVTVMGRVLEDNSLAKAASKDNYWANFMAMLKRFVADEIPGVRIRIQFYNYRQTVRTDESGVFEAGFMLDGFEGEGKAWHDVHFELLDEIIPGQGSITATGEVLLMQDASQYGVISDVDDTIMISHSFKTVRKLRLMLFKNARTRMPFLGVAAFYRALHQGKQGNYVNPVFFVSSSEWNLYDLLIDFCSSQDIPKAPFLLKTLKTSFFQLFKSGGGSHLHKLDKIEKVLSVFRDKPFILIGDSGQHDAEIYARVVADFPGRILAIYIRDVRKSRHKKVKEIADKLKEGHGVEMLLVTETSDAAEHAIRKGYIRRLSKEEIEKQQAWEEKKKRLIV